MTTTIMSTSKVVEGDGRGKIAEPPQKIQKTSGHAGYTKQIQHDVYFDYLREVEHCMFLDIAIRKLWSSINPVQINMTILAGEHQYPPGEGFMREVLNGTWSHQLYKAIRSILIVGYYLVVYAPIDPTNDTVPQEGGPARLRPIVVPPEHYILRWDYDEFGMRHYHAQPYRLTTIGPTNTYTPIGEFDDCDIFMYDEPTDGGQIASRLRMCMPQIMYVQQFISDYSVVNNTRSNIPLVTETGVKDASHGGGLGGGRIGTVLDDAAIFNARNSAQLSNRPSIGAGPRSPDDIIGLHLGGAVAMRTGMTRANAHLIANSIAEADTSTKMQAPYRVFNNRTGRVVCAMPKTPWENGRLDLPIGSTIGDIKYPEPPKTMPNMLHILVSFICSVVGIPQEAVMGSSGKDVRVSATEVVDAMQKANVSCWRNELASDLERIYWHIYGVNHVNFIYAVLDKTGIKADEARVAQTMKQHMHVRFTFQPSQLDYTTASDLYEKGYLTWDEFKPTIVSQFGVREEGVPTTGPREEEKEMMLAASKTDAKKPKPKSKPKQQRSV